MNTAQRIQSHQKRRWAADPSAIFRVLNSIQLFTKEEQVKLTTPMKLAYEKLRTGAGIETDFHVLAAAVNVTMVLAEDIDPLAEQGAIAARDGMVRCWQRYQRTGRLGFDGQALQDLPMAIDLHDQMMAMCTPLQVNKAAMVVNERMQAGEVMT